MGGGGEYRCGPKSPLLTSRGGATCGGWIPELGPALSEGPSSEYWFNALATLDANDSSFLRSISMEGTRSPSLIGGALMYGFVEGGGRGPTALTGNVANLPPRGPGVVLSTTLIVLGWFDTGGDEYVPNSLTEGVVCTGELEDGSCAMNC